MPSLNKNWNAIQFDQKKNRHFFIFEDKWWFYRLNMSVNKKCQFWNWKRICFVHFERFEFGAKSKWKNYIKSIFHSHPEAMINRNSLLKLCGCLRHFQPMHLKTHWNCVCMSKRHIKTPLITAMKFDSGICLWRTIHFFRQFDSRLLCDNMMN